MLIILIRVNNILLMLLLIWCRFSKCHRTCIIIFIWSLSCYYLFYLLFWLLLWRLLFWLLLNCCCSTSNSSYWMSNKIWILISDIIFDILMRLNLCNLLHTWWVMWSWDGVVVDWMTWLLFIYWLYWCVLIKLLWLVPKM